jgi:cytochrome b
LAAAFAIAFVSAEEEIGGANSWHVWSGYTVGILIAIRVLWGLIGTRHARFADFVYSPIVSLRYLADLLRGRARRYIGHSPAAGVMILALLFCLGATVVTGLVEYGESGKGPLAGGGGAIVARALAGDDEGGSERGSAAGKAASSASFTESWRT